MLPLGVAQGDLRLAMVDPLDEEALSAVRDATSMRLRRVVVTNTAYEQAIQTLFAARDSDRAVNSLLQRLPEQSARSTLTAAQKLGALGIGIVCMAAVIISPINALIAFNIVTVCFYLSFSAYRLKLIYNSLSRGITVPVTDEDLAALDERRLPVFTLLVPLYREAAVVPEIIASLNRLDYPRTKLDVKLLCEADDLETIEAIEGEQPPPHFHLLVVPDGQPKTKPKACNYGLMRAQGELVVIYDAEDRPEPDQLRRVVAAFAKSDAHVVCVQCKLNYYNQDQNLLTRWFTTEYSMWFDLFLPGLDALDAPIPLGGTSNHFVTAQLHEFGGWDPYNVTEDADLGIRLARAGFSTIMIESTTYEEANPIVANWIRQRSRWVKGYIQTWLVHMRHPVQLGRGLGWRRFWSFQFVVAGTFITFLLNPFYWALTTVWVFTQAQLIRDVYPAFLYFVASFGLFIGNFVFVYANAAGAMWRGNDRLVKYALLTPLYWGLMSIAAWRGLFQLVTRPHYWEKTTHGLTDVQPPRELVAFSARGGRAAGRLVVAPPLIAPRRVRLRASEHRARRRAVSAGDGGDAGAVGDRPRRCTRGSATASCVAASRSSSTRRRGSRTRSSCGTTRRRSSRRSDSCGRRCRRSCFCRWRRSSRSRHRCSRCRSTCRRCSAPACWPCSTGRWRCSRSAGRGATRSSPRSGSTR